MGREVKQLQIQYIDMSGPSKCRACRLPVRMISGELKCPKCLKTPSSAHLGAVLCDVSLMTDAEVENVILGRKERLAASIEMGLMPEAEPGYLCSYCSAYQHQCFPEGEEINMDPLMKKLGIELSTEIDERHIKIMWWGPSGARKTETIVRYFPHVLLIDTEGNSDQIDRAEVPQFLVIKTKDPDKILEVVDAAATGKFKFPDGSPVETLGIDSGTIIWQVGQQTATKLAENRAERYNKPKDEATNTQLDWVVAKRPIKKLFTRFNNSPLKYLVMTCREKDLYDDSDKNSPKKIGVTFDMVKGTEYEFNAVLHFQMDHSSKWFFDVTKVQGALKKVFPIGKRMSIFPEGELMEYAKDINPRAVGDVDEEDLGAKMASKEGVAPRTQADLIKAAKEMGIESKEIGKILAAAGFNGFKAEQWDGMVAALKATVAVSAN